MSKQTVLLFDIDGTLIRCGGAGGKSLCAALADEFGLSDVRPVALHGRTDLGILNELLTNHGLESSGANRDRLCERYFSLLPNRLIQLVESTEAFVLPGVVDLLRVLSAKSHMSVALLTGNMPTSAQIKLQQFDLWSFFEFGIFGHVVDHRPLLAEPARLAIEKHCGGPIPNDQTIVIGDTPLDIELARAMGARSLAVCTGGFSTAELHQAGADLVLQDLSDTGRILRWLEPAVEAGSTQL